MTPTPVYTSRRQSEKTPEALDEMTDWYMEQEKGAPVASKPEIESTPDKGEI